MRTDLKKVICEHERRGSRDYNPGADYDRQHQPAAAMRQDEDEYPELEYLPNHESMTARLGWDNRNFSDRLGAIKGLVRKAEGKNWDKIYSELCRQVSPTGTVTEQHVHQHLKYYICLQTRMLQNGQIEVLDFRDWEPVKGASVEYYVHPVTRRVVKNKYYKPRHYSGRDYRARQAIEDAKVFRYTSDPMVQCHKIKGCWYRIYLEPIVYEQVTTQRADGIVQNYWNERNRNERVWDVSVRTPNCDPSLNEMGRTREYKPVKKQALNSQLLKHLGLENDKPNMDLTHNRRSRYG